MDSARLAAIVHPDAEIGSGVEIGPGAIVHERVRIGDGCRIGAFSVVHAGVSMGVGNQVSEHVVLGGPPQDLAFDADLASGVEIGSDNVFREFFTVHRSVREGGTTRIGSGGLFMSSSHVAHDCVVGDRVVIGGGAALAGHVRIESQAFVSGHVVIHQFARVGKLAMVAGLTAVPRDVLPFHLLGRDPVAHYGLNRVGLKRAGIPKERYRELEAAWRALRGGGAVEDLRGSGEEIAHLKAWLSAPSERGRCAFLRPGMRRGSV